MRKFIAVSVFIFLASTLAISQAATSTGEKKETKSATHKHHDKKDGCCCMKNMSEERSGDCGKMDSKKDSEKETKDETKKESEKK